MGLSQNASDGADFNFTEVHMTQRGADDAAFAFIGVAWGRYKNVMGHPDITIDEYLELLRQGKGNIEIYDEIARKKVMIDPRQDFSLVITGDTKSNMPLRCYDNLGFYFSSDEKGKLVYATNAAYINYQLLLQGLEPGAILNSMFVYDSVTGYAKLLRIPSSTLENGSNNNSCDIGNLETNFLKEVFGQLVYDEVDFFQGVSDDPLFTLR